MASFNFLEKLKKYRLKATRARLAILDALNSSSRPLDADELYEKLEENKINVDQATVYRILDIFHREGIVRRLEFHDGKYRHELGEEDHHHLVCEECGSVEDISGCFIPRLETEILRKKHFLVKHHNLEFFGLCKSCQP